MKFEPPRREVHQDITPERAVKTVRFLASLATWRSGNFESDGRKSGFSILEVLIALTVFAIGIGSLLTALGYHLRDVSAIQSRAQAVRIAEREMSVMRRETELPEESEGEEDGFTWIALASELDLSEFPEMENENGASQALKPALLEVEVRWGTNEKLKLEAFENFRY